MTLRRPLSVALLAFLILATPTHTAVAQPADGSIVGWGSQVVGVDLSARLKGVAAGWGHSLGLKGVFGDSDVDADVDLGDAECFVACLSGPRILPPLGCGKARLDGDWDVDLRDFAVFQRGFVADSK